MGPARGDPRPWTAARRRPVLGTARRTAHRPAPTAQPPGPSQGEAPPQRPRGGLFGSRRSRDPEIERAFSYEGDQLGAQGWALQHGWTVSDGSGPDDAALADVLAASPVRPGKEARPAGVLRGRAGAVELVAFDVVYPWGRQWMAKYAITAAPLLGSVPVLRLSPARLWKHRTGALVPVLSGNEAFDSRWQLLAAEDGPQVRRLAQDPAVQGLLLGTDDGDEFWTGAGAGARGGDLRRSRPARRAPTPAHRAPRAAADGDRRRAGRRLLTGPIR
ncbi:hypothetical protein [Blastococcus brunescens]|uniref:ATP-dependent DNA ligase family profile domain-containing protein n=1 Tax=Blastococcus brunescens TaxID=1564165 RepID=A0ABZ1B1Q7_9ACTN|nr:hypothetical protein [Blastococcus sp. BMG 8361]WRL63813.1 hypothetical protein U6N30_29985 [Blastococcus sp. BMG 8361]